MPKQLILASASPRRKELLALLGLPFEVVVSNVDEESDPLVGPCMARMSSLPPKVRAEAVAWSKAWDVWLRCHDGASPVVIAADTIVATNRPGVESGLGKPSNEADASRMLSLLSGTSHTVYTGVVIMRTSPGNYDYDDITRVVDTQVQFRELAPAVIDAYVATGEPFDKAGAYGIQGYASAFVEAIYGDYFNVVGLPVSTVAKMLEEIGIDWWRGPAALE
jgi:septum formation protein